MRYEINKIAVPFMFTLDLIGNTLFFWTKLRKQPEKMNKVLFIRLEHIGDMIMATPCFETFKKNHPKCEVHILCRSLTSPLIKNNPYVDKIIEYDAPWFLKRGGETKKSFSQVIKQLRDEKYDIIFEMHGDPRNIYLASRTGSFVVGYPCRGFGFLLNKTIDYNTNVHMIKQNLKLIEPFCKSKVEKPRLFTDKSAEKDALRLMKKYSLKNRSFVILNPRSGRVEKDLTDEESIAFINKHKSAKVVLTGSKAEISKNGALRSFPNVIDLTGKTNLLTLIELVRHGKKVIGPDTGIIHIANAVNTPFEAIYKTTNRRRWGY